MEMIRAEQLEVPKNQFEISIGEGRILKVTEGNIAGAENESLFFLNFEDDTFPCPGPVFERVILGKDEELKERGEGGEDLETLVSNRAKNIEGAQPVTDEFSAYFREKTTFPSQPYRITTVEIDGSRLPQKRIFFGNIGSEDDGVLIRTWHPESEQHREKIKREMKDLLTNLFASMRDSNTRSVAMPILTGSRASSQYFYEVLAELAKDPEMFPQQTDVYAYEPEDFEMGKRVLKGTK